MKSYTDKSMSKGANTDNISAVLRILHQAVIGDARRDPK